MGRESKGTARRVSVAGNGWRKEVVPWGNLFLFVCFFVTLCNGTAGGAPPYKESDSMSQNNRSSSRWVLLTLFFALGLLVGIMMMQRRFAIIRPALMRTDIPYVPGSKLGVVMEVIENNYVDTVNEEKVTQVGLDAVLHSLDPHSAYLPAQDFEKAEEEIQGNFQGIGVQFRMINDTVTVIMPISGGPSEKVGVLAGDRIIVAGGDTLSGKKMSTDNVMKKLKGPKGTRVRLGLAREGVDGLVWVEVKRDVIPTYSVDAAFVVEPGLGYVKVSKFAVNTAKEFERAVRTLSRQGVNTLIVDLRSNGGGLLGACLDMADMFLEAGQGIVYTEGRNRRRTEVFATGKGRYQDMELIVLMDEWSASASEIFAGAIQDNDRGVVIGRRSFGKGLVQEQMTLSDGSALRLTVARYYTPSGRCIQKSYEGGYEDYEEDMLRRYLSGEMTGKDTVSHTDTVKYYTRNGRVVYGGGGILPDIAVPYKTDSLFVYTNKLSSTGHTYDFSFRYANAHRAELKKRYPDAASFTENFVFDDTLFEEFLRYSEGKGLERHPESLAKYGPDVRLTLKALIGRNLYDDAGFYPTYLQRDDDFLEALRLYRGESLLDPSSRHVTTDKNR